MIKINIKLATSKIGLKGGYWGFKFPQHGYYKGSAIEGGKQTQFRYSGIGFRIILRKATHG